MVRIVAVVCHWLQQQQKKRIIVFWNAGKKKLFGDVWEIMMSIFHVLTLYRQ